LGGIKKALLGSSAKTKSYSTLGDRSTEGQSAINTILPTATSQYSQGAGLISQGTDWLNDLATTGTNDYVKNADSASSQLINTNTNKNFGSALNTAANNGVVNSTQFSDTAAGVQSTGNQQLLSAHQQNLSNAYNVGNGLLSSGSSLQSGLTDFSKQQEALRQGGKQTVQEAGSTGLLGSFASSASSAYGKSLFS